MVIDATGVLFLLIVCAGVPYLALRSRRVLDDGPLPMPRRRFFIQTILMQLYLAAIAVVAAWRNGVDLIAPPPSPAGAWGLAALFLAVLLAVMWWRWPHRDRDSKERLMRILPRERGDLPWYFALCATAGVCEEAIYRGVAVALLARVTGALAVAILLASVAFALAHVVQGWRSAVAVFGIALMAHALVLITRSLFPVMAVHAIYDAIAGVMMPRLYARENASTVAAP
jgi:membrane protease YdiL (CAAX protease family)